MNGARRRYVRGVSPRKYWTFFAIENIRRTEGLSWNLAEEGNMRIKRLAGFVIVMMLTALTLFVATARADQLSGTWNMNAEKSKYNPGPPPKSLTVVVESDENNYKIDTTGTVTESRSTSSTVRNLTERTIQVVGSRMRTQFR
jgi:hypothetical protein